MPPLTLSALVLLSTLTSVVHAASSYPSDFLDPTYLLHKNWTNSPHDTTQSQQTIIAWADSYVPLGPWNVTSKPADFLPPSGDMHDYMSFSPYWWPDCSKAGNTTALDAKQIQSQCPYFQRDGIFNPDVREANDVGHFDDMSNAVLYNTIAWALNGTASNVYSQRVAKWLSVWFLDDATHMNPNLNYAQRQRGPTGINGTHTGILDLKGMTRIATAVLALRNHSPDWTSDMDGKFTTWITTYIGWLESAPIALEEKAAPNNHGSFYFVQLIALKLIANDMAGANKVVDEYFNGIYMNQIEANGEQPLEAARTRPYHYRAYNLAAIVTIIRMAEYASNPVNYWNFTTKAGATPKNALDFAMTIPATQSKEDDYADELFPPMAAIASVFGDEGNKYSNFIKAIEAPYQTEAWYLWDQPFAPGDTSVPNPNLNGTTPSSSNSGQTNASDANGASRSSTHGLVMMLLSGVVALFVFA